MSAALPLDPPRTKARPDAGELVRSTLCGALVFLAFTFGQRALGDLSAPAAAVLGGLACLAALVVAAPVTSSCLPRRVRTAPLGRFAGLAAAALVAAGVAVLRDGAGVALLGGTLVVAAARADDDAPSRATVTTLGWSLFAAVAVDLWFGRTAAGLATAAALAEWMGAAAHAIGGFDVRPGPLAAGLPIAALGVIVVLGGLAPTRRPGRVLAAVLTVLVVTLGYLASLREIGELLGSFSGRPLTALSFTWVLAGVLGALATAIVQRHGQRPVARPGRRLPPGVGVALAGAALVAVGLRAAPRDVPLDGPVRLVVHDPGYLDTRVPTFERFGVGAPGMFGLLEPCLDGLGFDASRRDITKDPAWREADVLVFVNLMEPLEPPVAEAVRDHVRAGGGLLVLGDHTGKDAFKDAYDALLAPFGVGFRFDTAKPFRASWEDRRRLLPHPVTAGVAGGADDAVWVGASLDVRAPAYPVVVARDAFSDEGDPEASDNGFLGTMAYELGERLGDLPLVAAVEPGAGRVLVFGDTSPFQNTSFTTSSPFIERSLRWLAHGHGTGSRLALSGLLVGLGAVLLVLAVPLAPVRPGGPGLAGTAAVVAVLTLGSAPFGAAPESAGPPPGSVRAPPDGVLVAGMDGSLEPAVSRLAWKGDGVLGLELSLLRSDVWPRWMPALTPRHLADKDLLFLTKPLRDVTRDERAAVEAWVRDGGVLVATVGRPESDRTPRLLTLLGCGVARTPLGPVQTKLLGTPVRFLDAFPLGAPADADVIAETSGGRALAARRALGRGFVYVVADSQFFENENVEGIDEFVPENIQGIRQLVADARTRRGERVR